MAIIDVTNNGVTLNSTGDALSNATAIVDILETQTSTDDTVTLNMSDSDVLYLDTNDAALARVVDLNGNNIPDGVTLTNNTDSNDEPAGVVRAVDSLSVQSYFFELSVRDGMDLTVSNIEFDANNRNNGNVEIPFIARDGDGTGITFTNCLFRNGGDVGFRELDGSGIRFEYCSFRDSPEQHGCAITHRDISTANYTEFYRCHFTNNGVGGGSGGYGLNQSPGKTRVIECVIEGNKRGVKWGTDPGSVGNFPVDYQRVRIGNCSDDGIFILADNTLHDVTHLVEDVIVEDTGDYGLLTGGSADDDSEVRVAADSQFVVLNSTDNNLDIRGDSTLSTASGGEIQSCGSGGDGIRYDSAKTSTIGTLNVSGNSGSDVNDVTGNLSVTSQTTNACVSDIAGVPTASEVGVGTVSSGSGTTRHGITFDTVLNAVDDLGLDDTGSTPIGSTLQNNVSSDTLIEFPPGEYLIDSQITDNGDGTRFGIRGTGSSPTDVTFVTPSGSSQRILGWEDEESVLVENVAFDMKTGTTDGILQLKFHVTADLQLHDIEWIGYWPDENQTTVTDGSGANLLNFNIKSSSGTGEINGLVRDGPTSLSEYPDGGQAIFAGGGHDGEIYIRDSRLANCALHGIYASRTDGSVKVEGTTFRNINGDMARISGANSYFDNCRFEFDTLNDDPDNVTTVSGSGDYPAGTNGIELESGFKTRPAADVRNCTFVVKNAENSQGIIMLDGSCGGCTIENNEFEVDDDIPIIFVREVGDSIHNLSGNTPSQPYDVTLMNNTVVSTAGVGSVGNAVIDITGRDGSTVEDCCIDADSPADGVRFDATQSASVNNSTIVVSGDGVVTVNGASVSTSNVSTTGACTLTGGTGTSLGNIVTAGGNVQTAGGNVQTGG